MIYEIAITGGPCSGKTSAKPYFVASLRRLGYRVFYAEEEVTSLFDPGIPDIVTLSTTSPHLLARVNGLIVHGYSQRRRQRREIAQLIEVTQPDVPIVILVERGEAYSICYTGSEAFE